MAAGNEQPQETKKKHVSFVNIEGLSKDVPVKNSECGLVLHVKGNGKLCIRSSSLDGGNDADIDILLNIKNQSKPVTLILPQEHSPSRLEINGDGDMQFSIKDVEESTGFKSKEGLNDLNLGEDTSGENGKERHKKTHRRNNSDFLQISGKDLNSSDSDDDISESVETKDCGTDVCSLDILLSEDVPKKSDLSTGCYRCSNNDTTCDLCIQRQGAETPELIEEVDTVKIQNLVETVLTFKDKDNSPVDTLPKSFECDWGESSVSCLRKSIRKSYTYLLDVLDLLDLCDHLYENSVIEIELYQKLFDMCYEPRYTRDAKRSLLMHLSTRKIRQDKMINALYGAAQYQLIPYFYPGVCI